VKPSEKEERKLARASFNWLIAQRQDKMSGSLFGQKLFLLKTKEEKMATFTRMINAAGGKVVENKDEAKIIILDGNPSKKNKEKKKKRL